MSGATLPLVLLAALAIFTGGVVLDHRRERRQRLELAADSCPSQEEVE